MPPAARVTDEHSCPKSEGNVPHGGGEITTGFPKVEIGGLPAARKGDLAFCNGPTNKIKEGSATVEIGGEAAARMDDPMEHGGKILSGCTTVYIGNSPQGASFMGAGAPLVKPCEVPKPPRSV
jgi:uncharacterized Zn-binding protein involved in type VI secretion